MQQFKKLLGILCDDEQARPGNARRRFVFFLDGLDEITAIDRDFPELIFACRFPGVTWICSGRGQHGLARTFGKDRCSWLFADEPGGFLPALDEKSVTDLVGRECRRPGGPCAGKTPAETEPIVKSQVREVAGLPLALKLLLARLREGKAASEEGPAVLLDGVWTDVLESFHISDIGVALTQVLCLLAVAKEPLDLEIIQSLLDDREPFLGSDSRSILEQVLEEGTALIRWTPNTSGDAGLDLAHPSLRAHLRSSPRVNRSMALAVRSFTRLFGEQKDLEGAVSKRDYALRHAIEHLLDADERERVVKLLMSPTYLAEKGRRVGVPALLADFDQVLASPVVENPEIRGTVTTLRQAVENRTQRLSEGPESIAMDLAAELMSRGEKPTQVRVLADQMARHGTQSAGKPCLLRAGMQIPLVAQEDLVAVLGSGNWITAVCLSPDGRLVALATGNQIVKTWDREARRELARFEGHTDLINSLAFSADGQWIVSGSVDHTARLWNAHTGREQCVLVGHSDEVTAVGFAGQDQVMSGSWDETIRFWSTATGHELLRFAGGTRLANCLALSPDGGRLVSGSWEKTLKVWDSSGGQQLATMTSHTDRVTSVDYSPDGNWIVSGSNDRTVVVWSATSLALVATVDVGAPVLTCRFSPDGHYVWVVDDGGPTRHPNCHVFEVVVPS